jgi:hypothetical protein
MKEFNLSHAVAVFSTFTGSAQSMWGLFAVASFTAAGFGASTDDGFSLGTALILTAGYAAFAVAHLRVMLNNIAVREVLAAEIVERLRSTGESMTDFPRSVAISVSIASGRAFTFALHAVIDACVVAIILSRGFGLI